LIDWPAFDRRQLPSIYLDHLIKAGNISHVGNEAYDNRKENMTFREKALSLMTDIRSYKNAESSDPIIAYTYLYSDLVLKLKKFFDKVYKKMPENCTDWELWAIMDAKTPSEEEFITMIFEEWQCEDE
jgi:hypothetical protein